MNYEAPGYGFGTWSPAAIPVEETPFWQKYLKANQAWAEIHENGLFVLTEEALKRQADYQHWASVVNQYSKIREIALGGGRSRP